MKQIFTLSLLFFSFILSAQNYVQVWGDEFNTPGFPDSTKWSYEVGKLRNNELQYYTAKRLENARIEDSLLILETRKENYEGAQYTSASIISKGIGDWKYGKFEISAKVPGGKGTWPAIWMLPTYKEYGSWPQSGEIDIMEYIGVEPQNYYFTDHFEGINKGGHDSYGSGPKHIVREPYNEFVKFTLIWTPEKMIWYANDIKFLEYKKPADDYRVWPFNKEFYMILNLAYGGTWAGYDGVDDSLLPHKFYIDYVRVYQLQESEGPFSLMIEPAEGGSVEISPKMDLYPEGTEVTLTATPDEDFAFKAWKHHSGANPYTFTINKNTSITPFFKDENQLLTNGNFNETVSPWSFYVNNANTASYQTAIEDGKFAINITKSPGVGWQLGFQELGLSLEKGKYKLTFDAYADQAKSVALTVSKNYGDYSPHISRNIPISTTNKTYEIILEMPVDDENVRLYFGIGTFTGKFYIDNIKLTRIVDNPTTLVQKEIIQEEDFQIYPNPTEGNFTIKIPKYLSGKEYEIRIFNANGILIKKIQPPTNETVIDNKDLSAGIYFIQLKTRDYSHSKKLVITKNN
jgi:beta-glucanase (GH16 family)